ncbi:type I restriction endonuclease [Flavobacteriaceae bacterium M23B6Z8]
MELHNQIHTLADKIQSLKDKIDTEEATKHAFVLPFINALGYDTFNPMEVIPEFTADLGLKKGEKVDYAIFRDEVPILIIECKSWKESLDPHNSQLFLYFHTTKTRFALLTNGIHYKFYSDLENSNKMDEKPFLEFDITKIKEAEIVEVSKFQKTNFDIEKIVNNASALKYTKEIRKLITAEIADPSIEFVRLFASKVYTGRLTEKVIDSFTGFVQKAFGQTISDRVNERLNTALNKEAEKQQEDIITTESDNKIDTTEEELEAFRIIVAILRRKIPIQRIFHRDTQSYFGILLDDNNRKPICRLHFNGTNKYLGLFDTEKNERRELLRSLEDIYDYEEALLAAINYYI